VDYSTATLRLADDAKMEALKGPPPPTIDINQFETRFDVGNLGAHQFKLVGVLQIPPDAQELLYNIFIVGRNGQVVERYQAKKVNGDWKVAITVNRDDASYEKLYERIDPTFRGVGRGPS
jgi:hypothetical protein